MVDTGRTTRPPREIRLFEGLMVVSVALGALQLWLGWERMGGDAGVAHAPLVHILCLVLSLLLTFLVSRGRSNLAKWLLILLFILCLLAMYGFGGAVLGLLAILAIVLELIALALLFTPPAIAYLDHKPSSV